MKISSRIGVCFQIIEKTLPFYLINYFELEKKLVIWRKIDLIFFRVPIPTITLNTEGRRKLVLMLKDCISEAKNDKIFSFLVSERPVEKTKNQKKLKRYMEQLKFGIHLRINKVRLCAKFQISSSQIVR